MVFPSAKIVVFIDGCFWHRCPDHFQAPANNSVFWQKKIAANVARDAVVNEQLGERGWRVLRYWEHQVRTSPADVVASIMEAVRAGRPW